MPPPPQSNHIKGGWSVFPGEEAETYCVGFTWKDGEEELLGNMMFYISLGTTARKGYRAIRDCWGLLRFRLRLRHGIR